MPISIFHFATEQRADFAFDGVGFSHTSGFAIIFARASISPLLRADIARRGLAILRPARHAIMHRVDIHACWRFRAQYAACSRLLYATLSTTSKRHLRWAFRFTTDRGDALLQVRYFITTCALCAAEEGAQLLNGVARALRRNGFAQRPRPSSQLPAHTARRQLRRRSSSATLLSSPDIRCRTICDCPGTHHAPIRRREWA